MVQPVRRHSSVDLIRLRIIAVLAHRWYALHDYIKRIKGSAIDTSFRRSNNAQVVSRALHLI
jgi:hypothetical protein